MKNLLKNIKRIKLRNKYYSINFVTRIGPKAIGCLGDCSDPNKPNKTIRYRMGMKNQERLDVFIHEMLHACFWELNEEAVEQTATDTAKVLWKIGFRMEGDDFAETIQMPAHINLRGKRYSLSYLHGNVSLQHGEVSSPHSKNKFIKIKKHKKDFENIYSHLYLLLLICLWDIDEDILSEVAKDIAKALDRIGYSNSYVYS